MPIEFEISAIIIAPVENLYRAWLDSELHTKMTGGKAEVSDQVGGSFTAWDGYISGKNLELDAGKRILQTWRTTEFADSESDSKIEIWFEKIDGGTKVTLKHTDLPPHGTQYEQGWEEAYFQPMREYFTK